MTLSHYSTSKHDAMDAGDQRLSVVISSTVKGFHGGERQSWLLAKGLRDRGHVVTIFGRRDEAFASKMIDDGFSVISIPGRGRSPSSLLQMRKIIRKIQPDVVHFNDSHAITSTGIACAGMHVGTRIAARRVVFPMRSSLRYQFLTDHVICVSSSTKQACRDAGIDENRLSIVHDGVDPSLFLDADPMSIRTELDLAASTKILLKVAKLTDCKGHSYLIEAMSEIVQQWPDIKLLLAGDGPQKQMLEQLVKKRGLSNHILFLGYRNDIPNLMAAADLKVVASHSEGLCSSIIDAMFSGCPVVATKAGGIPDLMNPGELNGWQVRKKNPNALAAGILEALHNPELCAQRATRARQFASQYLTHDAMVENTIRVYHQLLNRKQLLAA